jgi:hypothetical protein
MGRPAEARGYGKTIKTENRARITIRFRKARVTTSELQAALRLRVGMITPGNAFRPCREGRA